MNKPQQTWSFDNFALVTFLFLDAEPELSFICFTVLLRLVPFLYWDLYFNNVIRALWQWIVLAVSLTVVAHAKWLSYKTFRCRTKKWFFSPKWTCRTVSEVRRILEPNARYEGFEITISHILIPCFPYKDAIWLSKYFVFVWISFFSFSSTWKEKKGSQFMVSLQKLLR